MSYAKAVHPYQTGVVGDLALQVDDIVEVNTQLRTRHCSIQQTSEIHGWEYSRKISLEMLLSRDLFLLFCSSSIIIHQETWAKAHRQIIVEKTQWPTCCERVLFKQGQRNPEYENKVELLRQHDAVPSIE